MTMTALSKYMLLALLAGCATPLKPAPDGWPELTVIEIALHDADVRTLCSGDGVARSGNACAIVNLRLRQCLIVSSIEQPMTPRVRQEELDHCDGRDHLDENQLERALEQWKTQ